MRTTIPVPECRQCSRSVAENLHVLQSLWCNGCNCPCPLAWPESPRWENHPPPGQRRNDCSWHDRRSHTRGPVVHFVTMGTKSSTADLSIESIHGINGILSVSEMHKGVVSDLLHSLHCTYNTQLFFTPELWADSPPECEKTGNIFLQ